MKYTIDDLYELSNSVSKELDKFRLWCDVEPEFWNDFPAVRLIIHWGDWKHEHLRAKYLCEKMGGRVVSSVVTEENGSDTYSADHVVVFPVGMSGFKTVEAD